MKKYDLIIVTKEPFPCGLAATNRLMTYARELSKNYTVKVIVSRPTELSGNVLNNQVAGSVGNVDFEYAAGTTIWPQQKGKLTKLLLMFRTFRNVKKLLKAHKPCTVVYASIPWILAARLRSWKKRFGFKLFHEISELTVLAKNPLKRRVMLGNISRLDGHVTMTQEITDQMHKHGDHNTFLLPMSVDISRFPQDANRVRGKYFFYCCGATWERDGALDFLQAFEQFCAEEPEYELHMAGRLDPDNSYHRQVKEFIENSPACKRMKLLGQLPADAIPELLMTSAAAVMSPAKDYVTGGFPTKLGEYLASGVPVICTKVSEIPLYLNSANAYITEPGNVAALKEFMLDIVRNPEHASEIARNGRAVAEKSFVISSYARELAAFLELDINKKHIGFLAPTAYSYFHGKGFGGAELQVRQLSRMFYEAGYKVTVLTNDPNQPRREFINGIHLEYAPLRFLGGSNWYFLPDTLKIIRQFKKLQLDWCFFKNPNTALFQLGLARKFNRNMQIVKIFASDGDCRAGKSPAEMLYRYGCKWCDKFVFQTRHQQKLAGESLQLSGAVIPNIFTPPPQSPAVEKDIDVLWVGAFNSCKCPEKLLTIAQRLSQYKFTLISKPVSPEYHDLEKSLRALPNVDFVGTVPFEQTQNYFNRAIVYLCTSAVEGFPNTFLQSWHARAAVVSVTFPCDDILTGYHAGILAGNEEKAAAVIDELLTDSALRNKLCDNAQKYLVGNHLPAAVLEKFEKLING